MNQRTVRLARLAMRPVHHVAVRELPPAVQKALRGVGYRRPDIAVEAADTFVVGHPAGEGYRSFFGLVNLETGQAKVTYGSWGGPNINDPLKMADMDDEVRQLPAGIVALHGSEGGTHPVYATLTVHPSMMPALLPAAGVEATPQERSALNIVGGIVSSYRRDEFLRAGLGAYGPENPIIKALAAKGLVKVTGAGGIQITLKGKNVRGSRKAALPGYPLAEAYNKHLMKDPVTEEERAGHLHLLETIEEVNEALKKMENQIPTRGLLAEFDKARHDLKYGILVPLGVPYALVEVQERKKPLLLRRREE